MLRYIVIPIIAVLLALRVMRGPWGAKFWGVSERVLGIIYLVALVIALVAGVLTEYWVLVVAAGLLLLLEIVERAVARVRGSSAGDAVSGSGTPPDAGPRS
jgi:hypothetical protein